MPNFFDEYGAAVAAATPLLIGGIEKVANGEDDVIPGLATTAAGVLVALSKGHVQQPAQKVIQPAQSDNSTLFIILGIGALALLALK